MIIAVSVLFYLIGSIPSAYIYMKFKYARNILAEGSGNSGAMNVFDVTKSKTDGIIVLLLDLLKGFIPALVLIQYSVFGGFEAAIPLAMLIIGHNYPVWTKFRGGRGLSTAAGIMLVLDPVLVAVWLLMYFLTRRLVDNVHFASAVALSALPLLFYWDFFERHFIRPFNNMKSVYAPGDVLFFTVTAICVAALTKHVHPVIQFLKNKLK